VDWSKFLSKIHFFVNAVCLVWFAGTVCLMLLELTFSLSAWYSRWTLRFAHAICSSWKPSARFPKLRKTDVCLSSAPLNQGVECSRVEVLETYFHFHFVLKLPRCLSWLGRAMVSFTALHELACLKGMQNACDRHQVYGTNYCVVRHAQLMKALKRSVSTAGVTLLSGRGLEYLYLPKIV